MHHHGLGLIDHPLAVPPYLESEVRILTVGRCKALIEAADLLPEFGSDHDGRTGNVVHILHIVKFRLRWILQPSVVPARSIGPDDAAGLLEPPVGINELRAHHANAFVATHQRHETVQPTFGDLGVVVQEKDKLAPSHGRRLVAVLQEAHVLRVPRQHQIVRIALQLPGGICGHIVRNDDLIGRLLKIRILQDRQKTLVGIVDLVVAGNHDGHQGLLRPLKMELAVLKIAVADGKVTLNPVPSVLREIQRAHTDGMPQGSECVAQYLPLPRSRRETGLQLRLQLLVQTTRNALVPLVVIPLTLQGLNVPLMYLNHFLEVSHMHIREPLHLPLLVERHVSFLHLTAQLRDTVLLLRNLLLLRQEVLHRHPALLISPGIAVLTVAVDFPLQLRLPLLLHLHILRREAEEPQEAAEIQIAQLLPILFIPVGQHAILEETH